MLKTLHRLAALLLTAGGLATATERPNIILILMDDMGYNDVGRLTYPAPPNQYPVSGPAPQPGYTDPNIPAPNHARFLTPNIDSLASGGLMMSQFYSNTLCSPSRAALLTGRYSKRVSVNSVFFPSSGAPEKVKGLNTTEVTLPEILRERGYATGMVGKWHLGYVPTAHERFQMMPTRHGFMEFFGSPHSNNMASFDLIRNETIVEADFATPAKQAQLTWRYTEEALDFIQRKSAAQKPFFLWFAQIMTHIPCWPSDRTFTNADGTTWPKFQGSSGVSHYYDIVKEVDHSVGRVLAKLDELNIANNTLVIFTSDNGPWLNVGNTDLADRSVGSAYPFRNGKFSTWEGGVRVPLLARWPGKIAPGTVINDQVGAITDFLPTLTGLAGGTPPAGRTCDGIDLWPVWSGQSTPVSRSFAHFVDGGTLDAVVKDQWKLRSNKLYDVRDLNDQETTNHATAQPAVVADLVAARTAIENSLIAETAPLGVFTSYEAELSTNDLVIPAGGTATFNVSLSANPNKTVTVGVSRFSGNTDLSVSGGANLVFNTSNWAVPQAVTLSAASGALPQVVGATFRVTTDDIAPVREVFAFVGNAITYANLADLTTTPVTTLTPTFGPSTLEYTASVPYPISSMTVTPTAEHPLATIKVNGNTVASGSESGPITLSVGPNVINTVLTAEDASIKTYQLTVTVAVAVADPVAIPGGPYALVSSGSLSLNGSGSVPSDGATITAYDWDLNNDGNFNDNPIAGATPAAISYATLTGTYGMAPGANTIQLRVTDSAAKTSVNSATVTLTVASSNADLSNLVTSPVMNLTPLFASTNFSYTATVPYATTSMTVTPTKEDLGATIKVNGTTVASGSASGTITLTNISPLTNIITTEVTAEDGTTIKTYTLTVTRATPATNADTCNWEGDTSAAWATAANWDTLPLSSLTADIANFNLSTYGGNPVYAPNAGTTSINGITIGASNGAMTLATTNLSIGGSGITIASGAGALTVGKVTIGAAQSWTNNDNDAATFNGANAFTNKLTLAGGDFIFSGTNTGSGGIDLNAGKLIATVAGGFGPNTNTLKFGGGSLELRNDTATTFTGKIDMTTAGTTITVNRATSGSGVTHTINQATTLGGGQTMVMSPGANITANTDYGLTLSGTKTLTGDSTYTINGNGSGAGTLSLTFGGFIPGLGNTRTLTLNNGTGTGANKALIAGRLAFDGNGGTMVLAGSAPVFFYNLIQQSGSVDAVEINSTTGGVYTASTDAFANTTSNFTGGLTLTNGTLNIPIAGSATVGPLGNGGTFTINGGIIDNSRGAAVVVANVNPITVGGDFAFSTAGGTALNNLTLPGTVNLGGATRTITANGTGVLTLSGIISNGGLTKSGGGTLVLSHTDGNTYIGTTTINAGTLRAGAAAGGQAFGIGSAVTLADTAGATLNLNNFSQTIGSLAGGGTTGGNVTLGVNATLTTGGNDASTSYEGIISGTGTSGLTKTGNGTLSLNGTNTYTGATAIDAGTLLVNGSLAAGAVTVDGGDLGGTGTIGGAVTVNATGGVTPGASAGTLAITGNLTLTNLVAVATGKLKFELGANGIGTSDRITVGGNLILTDNNLNLADFQFISLAGLANGTYPLITYTGSITGGLDASNLIGTGNITGAGGTGDGTLQIDTDNKVVQLVVTNVSGGGSSAYDTWKAVNAPSGNPDDDYDGDGVSNAVEFVLGGLASTNDLSKLPTLTTSGGDMIFNFKRAQSSIDPKTAVFIEVGTDLAIWNNPSSPYTVPDGATAGPPLAVVKDSPSLGTDNVTLTLPQAPDAKKFARLKVVITP